jgi:hypothetical protein
LAGRGRLAVGEVGYAALVLLELVALDFEVKDCSVAEEKGSG